MNEWNKLSMKDRAAYIKLGIDSGIYRRGSVRNSLIHNTNKSVGTYIGKIGPKLAKNLGIVGMAIDTPNFVSDLENLKRALGLNYNEGLILK